MLTRLMATACFSLAVATSAQAMPRATPHQADSLITQIREGCGIGMVLVNGVCVARQDIRADRRAYYGNDVYTRGLYGPNGANGDWRGGYAYRGWDDYAARNGIICRPGTDVRLGDGMHICQ
jgi:hypothetical protein